MGTNAADEVYAADFGAVGDGTADDTAAINAAINHVSNSFGGGTVFLGYGKFLVSGLVMKSGVLLQGEGVDRYNYAATSDATTLIRSVDAKCAVDASNTSGAGLRALAVNGNGGDGINLTDALGIGIYASAASATKFVVDNVKINRCTYGIYADGRLGTLITNSVFRNNNFGARNLSDTICYGCIFTSNVKHLYINGGQGVIAASLFEFARLMEDGASVAAQGGSIVSCGIEFYQNAAEWRVIGNAFDRQAGPDIYIYAAENLPQRLTFVGNEFKRAGWGDGLTKSQRVSIIIAGEAAYLTFDSNMFQQGASGPSSIKGPNSPLGLADLGSAHGVVWRNNNEEKIARGVDLLDVVTIDGYQWIPSSVAGEYYLVAIGPYNADGSISTPYLIQPDYVEDSGVILDTAIPGSLSSASWGWGDHDSLGFPTVYVRRADDSSPAIADAVVALYDVPSVNDVQCRNLQRDGFADKSELSSFADGEQISFTLKTRRKLARYSSKLIQFRVYGRIGSNPYGIQASCGLRRTSTGTVSVIPGTAQLLYGAGISSVGWTEVSSLAFAAVSQALGDTIALTVANNTGSEVNDIRVEIQP